MQKNRRLIQVWAGIPIRDEEMGEVRVKVKLINAADEALAEAGHRVRSLIVDALVDLVGRLAFWFEIQNAAIRQS